MLTLYIANKNYSSWSLRPWVLMRRLGIEFDEQLRPLAPESSWDEYRSFSPNGLVPCLHDGDVVVWESLAIVEYLAEDHPEVWPRDRRARTWARCAAAEMHAGFAALRGQCSMNCGVRVRLHRVSAALQKDLERLDELWCEGLDRFGGPFLAGEQFTAADAFFAPVAFRIQSFNLEMGAQAGAYARRLLELDVMREWYASAIAETWRDASHDQQVLSSSTLIADHRATP